MSTTTFYWTLAMIRAKIEADLVLQDELFIEPSEMTGYINAGVRKAESNIHTLYEDYFLTNARIPLVSGTEEYSLLSVAPDIYAFKIRQLVYSNSSQVYQLHRVKDWKKFESYALERVTESSTRYSWFMINKTPGNPVIVLSPPAKETGSFVQVWYLRRANQLVAETDICDIPEFIDYVIQYAKVCCYEKEVGHPNLAKAMEDLTEEEAEMNGTLATMIPDAENEIDPDLSHYHEMS